MRKTAFLSVLIVPVLVIAGVFVYREFIAEEDRPIVNQAAQPAPYELVEVASGFSRPLYVTHAGDGSDRLFVVEQTGRIEIVAADGTRLEAPFLDVSDLLHPDALSGNYSERGLLGLAFAPDYAESGVFYINYTNDQGQAVLARYRVSPDDPDRADPASGEVLLAVDQPYANHNGGHLAFGPDGYLYMALGDGGSAGDPQNNGQDPSTLLGTIIRLDVSPAEGYAIPDDNPFVGSDTAQPEIWAYGVRNPWRFSFDRDTGDLYIADVGQAAWEEINFQPADSPGGENYGWRIWEGTHRYSEGETNGEPVMPVLEYNHDLGCSVTGGYVYRGDVVPGLNGYYLYGDWCSGTIWAAQPGADGAWQADVSLESGRSISSFGEDEAGDLYLVDYNGSVLRFEAAQ